MSEELHKPEKHFKDIEDIILNWIEEGTEPWEVLYLLIFAGTRFGLKYLGDDLGAVNLTLQGTNDAISGWIQERKESEEQPTEEKEITTYPSTSTDEKYYALIIGNNNYEHLEKLDAAENDAKVLANILQDKYGFEVELLLNGDYDSTVNSLFAMTNKLKQNDNLLIYYAGHGELDKAENRGYWLPVDANYDLRSKWISNTRIVDRIKATKAKHVLLMVDSCFSGSLTRGTTVLSGTKELGKLVTKKTRIIITSGGNEPVADSGGEDNHSVFAYGFIKTLMEIRQATVSNSIFPKIREYVLNNANQTPEMSILTQAGHDGGDFIFVPD